MRKALIVVAFLALCAAACGESAEDSGPLKIERAEWVSDESGSRAVVSGTWIQGLSTPPKCDLLEGENGEISVWPEAGANTLPDGNSFSKEFSGEEDSALNHLLDYHVRCSVNLSTGRTLETVARVSGETPNS